MAVVNVSSRYGSFSSNQEIREQAAFLFHRISILRSGSPFLSFLHRIRLLPLGRCGLLALSRIEVKRFLSHKHLILRRMQKIKRWRDIIIPNVFLDLSPEGIRQFRRAARDSAFLRDILLNEAGFAVPPAFSFSTLGRLYESMPTITHSPLHIRICNFHEPFVRWPCHYLDAGGPIICETNRTIVNKPLKKRRRKWFRIQMVIKGFRTAIRNASINKDTIMEIHYEFPVLEGLSSDEAEAYSIIQEIVKIQKETKTPKQMTSLSKYLHDAFHILLAEKRKCKLKQNQANRHAQRLIIKARNRLNLVSDCEVIRETDVANKIHLNLVPQRFLEQILANNLPELSDIKLAFSRALAVIFYSTGRRSSDFADVTVGHFSQVLEMRDLTIPNTKSALVKNLHLPLHRLLIPSLRPYVMSVIRTVSEEYSSDTTCSEILSGVKRRIHTDKDQASMIIRAGVVRSLDHKWITRSHTFRYAFGTWAPVAAILAWHQELCSHPLINPWVRDSDFFSPEMLNQWRDLTGSPAADPLKVVSRILGHSNPRELQGTYCVSWTIQLQLAAIIAAKVLGIKI